MHRRQHDYDRAEVVESNAIAVLPGVSDQELLKKAAYHCYEGDLFKTFATVGATVSVLACICMASAAVGAFQRVQDRRVYRPALSDEAIDCLGST
jgi:hypothetical protein